MRRLSLFTLCTLAASCSATDRAPRVCIDDGDPEGPPCVEAIETPASYDRISIAAGSPPYIERITKYIAPASFDPALLPTVFQNANRYPLHIEFLQTVFPERFAGFGLAEYRELMLVRATRAYYAGNLIRIHDDELGTLYGITAYTVASNAEALEASEARSLYERVAPLVTAGDLVFTFEPSDAAGPLKARNWIDPGFPIYFPTISDVKVEVYTPATNYGRVRLMTLAELDAAVRAGDVSWQDIVVVDEVPFDIDAVVAGAVTGGRQWELSHVNVRMARRGTPNLYVKNALTELAGFEGQLVRLEAWKSDTLGSDDQYSIAEASLADAQAWWESHRPNLGDVPPVDALYAELDDLLTMDVDDTPIVLGQRFGGKASNLAKLYAILPSEHQVRGFGIPFSYFAAFMEQNTIVDRRVDPAEEVSYREYVARLAADPRFQTDASYRRALLWDLGTRMTWEGSVSPATLSAIAGRIESVFGDPTRKVRFRSSSNVEDALEFSGAGLYASTSVCAADGMDSDLSGPSRCDSGSPEERTIERGLKTVWASAYNARAWDERDFYQITQTQVSMAILVTEAFSDEVANGVAFTGVPDTPNDARYLINAQHGDEAVVGNQAAIFPEKDLLALDTSGTVTSIFRVRSSVLSTPGEYVLSDSQLEELGALMFSIRRDFPLDLGGYPEDQVLLDLELKIDRAGRLRIKQIRPFLRVP